MDPRDAKTEPLIGRRRSSDEEVRLVILEGAGVRSLPVPGAMSLRIGRSGDVDVALEESSVSRVHLILQVGVPGDVPLAEVIDLGSQNGTSLAGRRLPPNQPFPLAPGEMLLVGEETA